MKNTMGAPSDDERNLFTARMLLLLESKPLFNNDLYEEVLADIVNIYFRDDKNDNQFNPLFLLNDILRFWRTLCLNYESSRHCTDKKYRKKNINLKFSRMLTVFGTVLYLISIKSISKGTVMDMFMLSPLERQQHLDLEPCDLDYADFQADHYLQARLQEAQQFANELFATERSVKNNQVQ